MEGNYEERSLALLEKTLNSDVPFFVPSITDDNLRLMSAVMGTLSAASIPRLQVRSLCADWNVGADKLYQLLEVMGSQPLQQGQKLYNLVLRPQVGINDLCKALPALRARVGELEDCRRDEIVEAAEIRIKYKGYIDREQQVADKLQRLERLTIRGKFDYLSIHQISTEGRQKLAAIDPETIGQASRIPGISPSDINILLLLLGR